MKRDKMLTIALPVSDWAVAYASLQSSAEHFDQIAERGSSSAPLAGIIAADTRRVAGLIRQARDRAYVETVAADLATLPVGGTA